MKKILLITLLLIPCLGFSQTTTKPIEGFLGIKFGSSKVEVIAAMKAKGYKPGNSENPDNYLRICLDKLRTQANNCFWC